MVHISLKSLSNFNCKANNKGHKKTVENTKQSLSNASSKQMKPKSLSSDNSKQIQANLNGLLSQSSSKQLKESTKGTNSNRKIKNFKPVVNKIANKYKTFEGKRDKNSLKIQQKCFKLMGLVPYEYRIANKLWQAMQEGESKKPWENINLRQLVVNALSKGVAWKSIESILYEYKVKQIVDDNCYLLEICYQQNVFLIVNVYTKNFMKFKKDLMYHTLNKYQATYDNVLQHFKCNCKIEALARYGTARQFAEFEMNLAKDAIDCRADGIEIHDYETGAVTFKSQPYTLAMMISGLEQKGYKILYTDYGFEALKKVNLRDKEQMEYLKFISDLQKYPEVTDYDDNVTVNKKQNVNVKENNKNA